MACALISFIAMFSKNSVRVEMWTVSQFCSCESIEIQQASIPSNCLLPLNLKDLLDGAPGRAPGPETDGKACGNYVEFIVSK